ncbi:TetR/AcrR family transcriptional regulator [Saccharopolyspora sp. NPDC047091]|uniref:TetR/AcrR family transcriptional regulator n=1 Tax=Saccharopolyspora sp. NPDC047091 TaxID=3155924 RepID=UPI00340A8011
MTRKDTRTALLDAAQRIFANKGYAAVGIKEVLTEVGVPKGSFYHYFGSKDSFGEAVLDKYFAEYLAEVDRMLAEPGADWATRLLRYWDSWHDTQGLDDCQGRCLAVKLGAEVADLSEPMRRSLQAGTTAVIDRLEIAITGGREDGSLAPQGESRVLAEALYELWLGASVLAKVRRELGPLDGARAVTRTLLGLRP